MMKRVSGWRTMEQPQSKRKRGVVLTTRGIERLKGAMQTAAEIEKEGKRFTLEDLSDRMGLAPRTVSRILEGETGLDKSTLELSFRAFGLALEHHDYGHPPEYSAEQAASNAFPFLRPTPDVLNTPLPSERAEFPGGPIPLNSPLYIERPPVEALAYAEIRKPGALLRIRAPRRMGKTSLMQRILAYGREGEGYRTVHISLQQADREVFDSLDKLLRWFCFNLSRHLQQPALLDEYWDEDMGSKMSATLYLQDYVLAALNTPLVLAIEDLQRVFEYDHLSQDFLVLLRSWHEEAAELQVWQGLRLVLVHATEVYVPLNLNQSPFNVGLPLRLPEFTPVQTCALAERYGLSDLTTTDIEQLMALVGGYPYLVGMAFYWLAQGTRSLADLLCMAPTISGIYSDHLRQSLLTLSHQPELMVILQRLVAATAPVRIGSVIGTELLSAIAAYKLESLGLVKLEGNSIAPSCELYRLYLREQLAHLPSE
jgi:transcriptional regulator with XRE-family HTH domain